MLSSVLGSAVSFLVRLSSMNRLLIARVAQMIRSELRINVR